jgi:hypothetical protein
VQVRLRPVQEDDGELGPAEVSRARARGPADRQASARREHATATQRLREREALRAELWASAKQRADVEQAVALAAEVGARIEANQTRLDALRVEVSATRDAAEQRSTGRVTKLRTALGEVIESKTIAGARKVAQGAIGDDDLCVRGDVQERLAQLNAELVTLTDALAEDAPILGREVKLHAERGE